MEKSSGFPSPALDDLKRRKEEIRAAALRRRDALPPEERARYSAAIVDHIVATDVFRQARSVMAYSSFGSEVDTGPLLRAVIESGKTLLLPRIDRATRVLAVHIVGDLERDLRTGVWGIQEPDPESCVVCPHQEIELIVMPGVAFDRQGGRIGYGRGYYDKLLSSCGKSARTLAGAFEVQVVDEVPMSPDDMRVEMLVTESGVTDTGRGSS